MSASFPLMKLPYLAFKNAIFQMNLLEIVQLSRCSKKTAQLIKSFKFPKPYAFNVSFGRGFPVAAVELILPGFDQPFRFRAGIEQVDRFLQGELRNHTVCGEILRMFFNNGCAVFSPTKPDGSRLQVGEIIFLLRSVADYLCDLFDIKLKLIASQVDFEFEVRLCMILRWRRHETESLVLIDNGAIHNDSLKFALEQLPNLKSIRILCKVNRDFQPSQLPPNLQWFVENGEWLTGNLFSKTSFRSLIVQRTRTPVISASDVNRFLKNWMNGEFSQLEHVMLFNHIFLETDVFEGIPHSPYDNKKRGPRFVVGKDNKSNGHHIANCEEGIDIENKNGVLGTILIKRYTFAFYVWHERFPNVEEDLCSMCQLARGAIRTWCY